MPHTIYLPVKPISVNKLYVGKRWKSPAAKAFEKDVAMLLAAQTRGITLPEGNLAIHCGLALVAEWMSPTALNLWKTLLRNTWALTIVVSQG